MSEKCLQGPGQSMEQWSAAQSQEDGWGALRRDQGGGASCTGSRQRGEQVQAQRDPACTSQGQRGQGGKGGEETRTSGKPSVLGPKGPGLIPSSAEPNGRF